MIKNCEICKKEYNRKPCELGKYCSRSCYNISRKGVTRLKSICDKISISKKGKSNGREGFKQTELTKQKIRDARAKQLPPTPRGFKYKGNITPELHLLRMSIQYKDWRLAIYERDNYTCQNCKKVGGKLNADHIESFARCPEKRFDINNGRTLCEPCHRKTSTFGGKSKRGFKMNLNICQF